MEEKRPIVSVIIPTYNRANLLSETLDSILAQTYRYWECIIVDDGSVDNTKEIVDKYLKSDSRFQYHQRPHNKPKGANSCRNFGFEKSRGVFINWFDSDDLMMSNKLASQVEKLSNSALDFVVCQTLVFEDFPENIIGLRKKDIYSKDFFNDFVTNDIKWLTQAPLIKREFLLKYKLIFDESLSQSQERDFFVKILDKVDDYLYDNTPLVLFRKHNQSISHGLLTKTKCDSNFRVNFNILVNYKEKLSKKSILNLKKALKSAVKSSVIINEPKLTNKFLFLLFKDLQIFSIAEKVKLLLGVFFIEYFKRGDVLFK